VVQIISGVQRNGQHQFIGEVHSGLQADLFCEICGSKLVAKKGQVNEWHFAHENGNQSQECLVGALNFIRRSVKDFIARSGKIPMPRPFVLRGSAHGVAFRERIAPNIAAIVDWCSSDDSSTRLADIEDSDGVQGEIHVLLSTDNGPQCGVKDRSILAISIQESLGVLVTQSVSAMCEQLVANASAQWLSLPSTSPSVMNAFKTNEQRIGELLEQQQSQLSQSNLAIPVHYAPEDFSSEVMAETVVSWKDDSRLQWAAELKEFSSIFCYQLKDGSQWFRYTTQTEVIKLKPWPETFDGCDECFPASVGTFNERMQCYVIQDRLMFPGAFNKYVSGMANTSNPLEVSVLFDSLTSKQ
jgi:hypothetical protein